MMDEKGVNELLERYRKNQCTAEEKEALAQWFDAQAAQGEWEWTVTEKQALEAKIKDKVDQQLFGKRQQLWPMLRIAAVLALVFASLFYFKNDIHQLIDPVVYLEKQVNPGQQLKLTLPDGTRVWLNAGSKFRYPDRFSDSKRQVFLLEGEGYFDVAHDPSNPFIVTSKSVNTKVLGTAFNIKAYQYLTSIQVAVTRGKVSVSDTAGAKEMIILPNEQISVNSKNGSMEKFDVDAASTHTWQRGGYAFNNDRMIDVCAVLSRKYGVQFQFIQKDIENYHITAGFQSNEAIADVLAVLASANNLTFQKKGDKVIFNKK